MAKNRKHQSFSSSLLRILGIATLIIVIAHLLLQFLNLEIFHYQNGFAYELSNRFDLDDESSVGTWFSQALFLAISMGAALAAYLSTVIAVRRLWQFIAIIGLLLSIDEVATLHEFVLQSLHNVFFRDADPTTTNNSWLLVTPFILMAVVWFVWKVSKLLPRRTMLLFATSIFTFLVGAIFFDALASIVDRETFLNQGVIIAIEESLELLGCIIAVYAIADYLEIQHGPRLKSALSNLK